MNLRPVVVELFQHGVRNCAADAAAYHADFLLSLRLGGLAQRADKVLKTVALIQTVQLLRRGTHNLDNDADSALLAVVIMDRQGDALAVLIHPKDDELAGLGLLCDHGGFNLKQHDGGLERLFSHDSKHSFPSFLILLLPEFHSTFMLAHGPQCVKSIPPTFLSNF